MALRQLLRRGSALRGVIGRRALDRHGAEKVAEPAPVHDPHGGTVRGLLEHEVVAHLDGVDQLIDLLNRVEADGAMILLAVPGTAVGSAEPSHDGEKIVDGGRGGFHAKWLKG